MHQMRCLNKMDADIQIIYLVYLSRNKYIFQTRLAELKIDKVGLIQWIVKSRINKVG